MGRLGLCCQQTADNDKPIKYKRLEHFRTFHGDIYVFPGCAIEHGVCNPAINPEVGRQHAFKKMRRASDASVSFVHQCLGATRLIVRVCFCCSVFIL